jgi:hypothetical protein
VGSAILLSDAIPTEDFLSFKIAIVIAGEKYCLPASIKAPLQRKNVYNIGAWFHFLLLRCKVTRLAPRHPREWHLT